VPVVVLNCKMSQLRKSIWEEKRAQACILSKEGHTVREISSKLGIYVGVVSKAVQRKRETSAHHDRPGSGHPRDTSKREQSKRNRRLTAPKLLFN
jgi:transposase